MWKKYIPGKNTIERDGKIWHFYPHYKNAKYRFPDSLYVCSHTPEEYDKWVKNKDTFYYRKPKPHTSLSKEISKSTLVMADRLCQVLTTSQPELSPDEIERFIHASKT